MGGAMGKNGVNFLDALPSQGTLHIVMLGLDSAGKTTALYRLKFDQYLNTVPTIGFNCEKVQGILGRAKGIQFLVWDVGGQEKLRPLWRSYTRSKYCHLFDHLTSIFAAILHGRIHIFLKKPNFQKSEQK
ncbi:ADP-ribosylation factor-like protein 4A isoform X3 [Bactrocera tryoni]|uniref:ADP-ribosylation factor-like protein 4A isoform X3 n=1 Tax=Bactrocera tryoni TaxID=59916 RepID=UPI001A97401A|nr:ADP-ribosylation factor-like protein 4A isoform X3 [Bactrocera tryoni]